MKSYRFHCLKYSRVNKIIEFALRGPRPVIEESTFGGKFIFSIGIQSAEDAVRTIPCGSFHFDLLRIDLPPPNTGNLIQPLNSRI